LGGIDFHGAHPQFNLIEGNILPNIYADSVWGSSSDTAVFRNWVAGANRVCSPLSGRGTVDCSGSNSHYGFQAARAVQLSYLSVRNRFVGNVIGSAQMQSLMPYGRPARQVSWVEYPAPRTYEAAIAWSFGYGSTSDDGLGTGCGGGTPPCHAAGTSKTDWFHGNYNNLRGTVSWAAGITQVLPASFYLGAKPTWWGTMPFPAIGPDVTAGSGPGQHVYGNPAQNCYLNTLGGSDGGAGSPLTFNASRCYGPAASSATAAKK
jgi:hypothetical protein